MADGEKRIIELEELTTLTDNDYIAVDNSASGGKTKKFKPKRLSDAITDLAETTEETIDGVIEETDSKFDEALALGTASGSIATFTDGSTLPMRKLEVAIEPVQSGSGEPSPTNVRPISGWDEVNVTVADDVETPTVSNVYTIDLDGTRYGGKLDVVSGVLTVDRVGVDLSSVSFTYDSNNKRWNRQFSDMKNYSARSADLMFEQYQATTSAYTGDTGTAFAYGKDIYIYDANQSLTISGKCIYELATPQTIQLTPTQVKSLLATNNAFADTGDILDATYVRNANITINDLIRRIEALEG